MLADKKRLLVAHSWNNRKGETIERKRSGGYRWTSLENLSAIADSGDSYAHDIDNGILVYIFFY